MGAFSPQQRQVQESPRNGLDQLALALPVMHTGHSSKRRCPVLSHHHVAFVLKGDMCVLPMFFLQGYTAKSRVNVCLSKRHDVHSTT